MKEIIKAIIIILAFSFLDGLILYITDSIRYSYASVEEISLGYVNAPDLINGVGIFSMFVFFLYVVFIVLDSLIRKYNVWLMCALILLLNMGIIYSFGSLAGNMFTLKAFFNSILIFGVNFFIPFAQRYLDKNLLKKSV